jgi:exopolyphosphatase / guanosine-5'-triphosphate,3'-diphosphate pyrophosphatase
MNVSAPIDRSAGQAVAALDCGTNSTRLLILSPAGQTLDREMRITRLGEGVDANRRLAPEAIARTLGVLEGFRSVMDRRNVGRARLVATSAVRDAVNGDDFLEAASAVVGFGAELLTGLEEGRTAYIGATADLPPVDGDDVVVDIGGGSTELILERDGEIRAVSLDLGCVRLTERTLRQDPPTVAERAQAQEIIDTELERAVDQIPELDRLRAVRRLIGLAGTVSTLAMVDRGLAEYTRLAVHHAVLSIDRVEHWCDVLADESAETRGHRKGMDPGRRDVIFGGVLILRGVMRRFSMQECLVSELDILDGLARSLLN